MKVEGTLGERGDEQRQDWAFFRASPEQFCPVESKDKLWAFWFHVGDCLMQKTGSKQAHACGIFMKSTVFEVAWLS